MRKMMVAIWIIFLVAGIVSCTTRKEEGEVKPTVLASITNAPTNTLIPSFTPSLTATQMPNPSHTPSPTRTIHPTSTAILTQPAKLDREKAKEAIEKLLQDYQNCSFPCYLGIVPSETTLGELENTVHFLGMNLHTNVSNGEKSYGISHSFDEDLSPNAIFFMKGDVVESIRVDFYGNELIEWLVFSPETLINQYGVPSSVSFFLDYDAYVMTMKYDRLDLIAQYGAAKIELGEQIQVCPLNDQFDGGRVWLGKNPTHPPIEGTSIEETSAMTVDEFYEYMLDEPSACFYLKTETMPP